MNEQEAVFHLATNSKSDATTADALRSISDTILTCEGIYGLIKLALEHESPTVRWYAVDKLSMIHDVRKAIIDLLPMLQDSDNNVCQEASHVIVILATDPMKTTSTLSREEKNTLGCMLAQGLTRWQRFTGATIISYLDDPLREEEIELIQKLGDDTDSKIRLLAVGLLEKFPLNSFIPNVWKHLKDPEVEIRKEIIRLIQRRVDDAKPIIPLLIELLNDPEDEVRFFSARAILDIDPKRQEPIPILVDCSQKIQNSDIRRISKELLAKFAQ